jgi:hypothetical protein
MENTKFGFGQFENKTPLWAKNVFRVTLLLTSIATFIVAADIQIPRDIAVRVGVYLKAFDLFVFGLSKMVGIEIEKK